MKDQLTIRTDRKPIPEDISPTELFQLISNVQDQKAKPEDAKRLMRLFCYYADEGCVPRVLLCYARDVFKEILKIPDNSKTDEIGRKTAQALRLVRRKGTPTKKERQSQIDIAKEILKSRLKGKNDESAKLDAHRNFGISRTEGGNVWKDYRWDALISLTADRSSFNPREQKIIHTIYKLGRLKKFMEEERNHPRYRKNPMRDKT